MYTIILDEGKVTRDLDGVIVSPVESADNTDFIEYINWVNSGNQPTIYDTDPNKIEQE